MKYLLTLFVFGVLFSCTKKHDIKPDEPVAVIDSVWAHKISPTEVAVELDITVNNNSLTGLELFLSPGFQVGNKIMNPRTGHYTIVGPTLPGRHRIELTTFGWRYTLPEFTLLF